MNMTYTIELGIDSDGFNKTESYDEETDPYDDKNSGLSSDDDDKSYLQGATVGFNYLRCFYR